MALTKPFAANGDKTPIKLNTTSDGVVNYENGFGARYSMPIKAVIDSGGNITKTGGLQIERGQMNQILNDFSSAIIENQENIGGLSNLQTTAKDNLVGAINEVNSTTPKLLTQNLEWSVGTGGKFTDLQSAINEASKYACINNATITIKLKTGFILSEEIVVKDRNISFVVITSETETKYNVDTLTGKVIFYFSNSRAPTLSINLSPNKVDNGNTRIVGGLNSDGAINGVFTDCPNIFYWDNGMLSIRGINVFNATKKIGSSSCGIINAAGSVNENYTKFENCNAGLFSMSNSSLYCNLATFKNCITEENSLYFNRGGMGVFTETRFINCKCNSSVYSFFQFNGGGIVNVSSSSFNAIDATNRCNITSNQITPHGIILVN